MVRLVPGFWLEHACRSTVERPIVRAERSGIGNPGGDRSDPAGDGDDADSDQHGDGHAGPDEHATGGVGADLDDAEPAVIASRDRRVVYYVSRVELALRAKAWRDRPITPDPKPKDLRRRRRNA